MQKIISLTKRRGFIFPSSEIYDGYSAVYDFGPYGVELAKNIKDHWWQEMVYDNENIVGLDSAIFMNPKVWEASGHTNGFSDPLTECKGCNTRSRVDHLLESIGITADEKMSEAELDDLFNQNITKLKCPNCKKTNFTPVRKFNMLVKSNLGNFTGDYTKEPAYLRGETAQGIYINFKNILDSTRMKIPFGVAQIGKAFRNEITARQFIFRKREFEQMEMQYFTSPEDTNEVYDLWKKKRMQYYLDLGFRSENLRLKDHENLVFYAKAATDIEYNFPFGFKELEGVHARGDYDLTQHTKASGVELTYTDPKTNEKYTPHIVETSAGLDRTFLAILCEFYTEEEVDGEVRVVLKLPPILAPIKVAVFPLLKNKPELVTKAKELFNVLKKHFNCEYDDNGNIGKRYRRQDEIGTPYCVTIDFDSLEKNTVTIRNRDTMTQETVMLNEVVTYLKNKILSNP